MTRQPDWLAPAACEMSEITDPAHFATLSGRIAEYLARRSILAPAVLRLRWVALEQIGCGREGRLVEALLDHPIAPAQGSWLEIGDEMMALETEAGRYHLAQGFDIRSIPDPGRREAALLDWLALLTNLPGLHPDHHRRPFRLWRSGAALAALHPPGIASLSDTILPASVRLGTGGTYEADCVVSHGNQLFSTTITGAPGVAPEMTRADLLAELAPGRLGFGPNGWLVEAITQKERSNG